MRVLGAVVEAGSFVGAAEALDTSNAAITRQIGALEAHLGARLLHRTTRRLSLTDAGSAFYERSRAILDDIAEAEALAGHGAVQAVGRLNLSAPLSFGITQLSRLLPGFRERHPQLHLDVDLTDRVVDLAEEGIDVALRIVQELGGNLIARRIAPVSMVVCASPAYLKRHGTPRRPEDLPQHETLGFRYLASGDKWSFVNASGETVSVEVAPRVHATNGDLLAELAVAGSGIVMQPSFIVGPALERGALVPLLTRYRAVELSLYAVYLSRRHLPFKVRAFIDYLVESVGDPPRWEVACVRAKDQLRAVGRRRAPKSRPDAS
jgi:DNA-binding transcriptional LysR family regulator